MKIWSGFKPPLLLLLLSIVVITVVLQKPEVTEQSPDQMQAEPVYPLQRTLRYSFTVQNRTNQLLEGATFSIYGPVKQTSFQLAKDISASHPYELVVDELGNQRLLFSLDFPPFASKVISITALVALSETPNALASDSNPAYLQHQKYIEVNDPAIKQLSDRFSSRNSLQGLQQAFDWVAENIAYAGYIEDDRGAVYALQQRRGDCTEYMYLFSALARSQQFPTRGIGGYVVAEDSLLKARDFHNWAEVYIDGQWRVVDPQHKKFLETEHHYVAMRLLEQRQDDAIRNTHGFSYADEKLELKMN